MSSVAVGRALSAAGLAIPECSSKSIGTLATPSNHSSLIEGVVMQPLTLWPDDRGWFLEVLRMGQGPASDYDPKSTQVSSAASYPGTIKAFHYHTRQTDYWVPVFGMFQVALVDLRISSPTFGARVTLYTGTLRPWSLIIPPGVGHGYKVIGPDPAVLVYVTNRFYDPQDEGRIAYDDPSIRYDWEIQHK